MVRWLVILACSTRFGRVVTFRHFHRVAGFGLCFVYNRIMLYAAVCCTDNFSGRPSLCHCWLVGGASGNIHQDIGNIIINNNNMIIIVHSKARPLQVHHPAPFFISKQCNGLIMYPNGPGPGSVGGIIIYRRSRRQDYTHDPPNSVPLQLNSSSLRNH